MTNKPLEPVKDLRQLLRHRRLKRTDVSRILNISLPTATRYLKDPMRMDGYQRRAIAELLMIEESQLHEVLSRSYYQQSTVD